MPGAYIREQTQSSRRSVTSLPLCVHSTNEKTRFRRMKSFSQGGAADTWPHGGSHPGRSLGSLTSQPPAWLPG